MKDPLMLSHIPLQPIKCQSRNCYWHSQDDLQSATLPALEHDRNCISEGGEGGGGGGDPHLQRRVVDHDGQLPIVPHQYEDEGQAQQIVQEHHGELVQFRLVGRQAAHLQEDRLS